LGPGHLDAAALADDALEPDPLVLAAVALPVTGRAEDLLAEEALLLGLERAVVDGLWLLDLTVRPPTGVVGRGESDPEPVEEVDIDVLVNTSVSSRLVFDASGGVRSVHSGHSGRRGSDFLDAARLTPGQVDTEFFGGAEHLVVGFAHLHRHTVAGENLNV